MYNNTTKKFTLKRCEKRQSTLKSLAPKKSRVKKIIEKVAAMDNDNSDDNSK
jgi:hypothetical protein